MARYGIILDAGSSGTRIYIYKWDHPAWVIRHASAGELHNLPRLTLKKSKKIHPGVSVFAEDVGSVGPDHLESLIKLARDEVPTAKIPETPIFLLATAGVRFLPEQVQTSLLQGICNYLQTNTEFDLPDCKSQIQVISGETEGLYGWIAANYLLGGFDHPEKQAHGKGHHTYGFLDMGGASAQIAFAPNATEVDKHGADLKLVRMRRLDGSSLEYKVFTATWLGFGVNKSRSRYIESLLEEYGSSVDEIPDPCMPKGLRTTVSGKPVTKNKPPVKQVLLGTGAFEECLHKTFPLLRKDAPCKDHPCLLNGQHVPAIDFDVNHFIGVSEYWHITHGVFGEEHDEYDFVTYQRLVSEYCNRDWADIEANLKKHGVKAERRAQTAREACFKASWLINMLHDGIGIPRDDLSRQLGINATKHPVKKAKSDEILSSFQPVNHIGGVEVTWTLGKMVLYATSQIPTHQPSSPPVGFGSFDASGKLADFEDAGSISLSRPTSHAAGTQNPIHISPIKSMTALLVLILLLLVGCLLRRPEWRRRLHGMLQRRHRSSSGRKFSRGTSSFISHLLGRSPAAYERVMAEGEESLLELGEVTPGEYNGSDSSGSPRAAGGGLHRDAATPRLNVDRFDDLRPPSEMDRNGLVIRTESRERLAPTLQMLNAGRRSRGGSPTRLKSPLVTSFDE